MISGYIFAAAWFLLAGYLFYAGFKESKFFFFLSAFFVFLGIWALLDELLEADLMDGAFGWIYRGVALVILIVTVVYYYRSKKND